MQVDQLGRVWLFGGWTGDYGGAPTDNRWNLMNDFWMYDPTTTHWNWV
jgi:hypothetical protein